MEVQIGTVCGNNLVHTQFSGFSVCIFEEMRLGSMNSINGRTGEPESNRRRKLRKRVGKEQGTTKNMEGPPGPSPHRNSLASKKLGCINASG